MRRPAKSRNAAEARSVLRAESDHFMGDESKAGGKSNLSRSFFLDARPTYFSGCDKVNPFLALNWSGGAVKAVSFAERRSLFTLRAYFSNTKFTVPRRRKAMKKCQLTELFTTNPTGSFQASQKKPNNHPTSI